MYDIMSLVKFTLKCDRCDTTVSSMKTFMYNVTNFLKALRETQTLRAGCSKVEPKKFAPPQTPFPGTQDGQNFNQLEMVTTFTYRPSLVRIDSRNFELSW